MEPQAFAIGLPLRNWQPAITMMQGMRLHLAFVHRSEMGKVFNEERLLGLRVIKLTSSLPHIARKLAEMRLLDGMAFRHVMRMF